MQSCLPEALLLLALDDEAGTVVPAAAEALPAALAAAVLLELGLRGRLHHQADGTVTIVGEPTGDPILDDAARRISRVLRAYSAGTWVEWLARDVPDLQDVLAERLVAQGVLARRGRPLRWLFSTRRYRLTDAAATRQLRATVRAALVDDAVRLDARTLALLVLVRAANLAEDLADGVLAERTLIERRQARRRVELLTADDHLQAFPQGLSGGLVTGITAGALAYTAAQAPSDIMSGGEAADGAGSLGQDLITILEVLDAVSDVFDSTD